MLNKNQGANLPVNDLLPIVNQASRNSAEEKIRNSAIDILQTENKKTGLIESSAIALSIVANHISQANNNTIPEVKTLKDALQEIVKAELDDDQIKQYMNNATDIIAICRGLLLKDSGLIVGCHSKETKSYRDRKNCLDKNGNLKNGFVEGLFYSPAKLFPNKNIGSEKNPEIVPNDTTNFKASVKVCRDIHKRHFLTFGLNDKQYAFASNTKSREEKNYALNNLTDINIALEEIARLVKEEKVLLSSPDGKKVFSNINGLYEIADEKINKQISDKKEIEKVYTQASNRAKFMNGFKSTKNVA